MNVSVFDFEGAALRVLDVEGEPWFVATDVARILGYRDAANLARRLDEDERGTRSVSTPSGEQQMTVVSESGFYSAVLGSQVEKAKAFKRWVTHDVLPSIRRTGSYTAPTPEPQSEGELYLRTGRVLYSNKCNVCRSPHAEAINRMLDEYTKYEEIIRWAAEHGLSISKGGLSRHNNAHRILDAAPRALLENPEIAARIMLAKLTTIAQNRSLEGLTDREVVKYQTSLAVSLSRGLETSRMIPSIPTPLMLTDED